MGGRGKINCIKCNLVAHSPLSNILTLDAACAKLKFSVRIITENVICDHITSSAFSLIFIPSLGAASLRHAYNFIQANKV